MLAPGPGQQTVPYNALTDREIDLKDLYYWEVISNVRVGHRRAEPGETVPLRPGAQRSARRPGTPGFGRGVPDIVLARKGGLMQDLPTANELVEAVREFLRADVLPELQGPRARFRTLVAMNALGILERELVHEESLLRAEHERLARLLGRERATPDSLEALKRRVAELNRDLAERIRSGEVPECTFGLLKQNVEDQAQGGEPPLSGALRPMSCEVAPPSAGTSVMDVCGLAGAVPVPTA